MAYTHNAPWYYAADGSPAQAVQTEDGWTYPQAAGGEERLVIIEDPGTIAQLNQQALGYNPDDLKVMPDGKVHIMNPATGQYEQSVIVGNQQPMPLSMAREQGQEILQIGTAPKDVNQFADFGGTLLELGLKGLSAYGLGAGLDSLVGMAQNGLGSLGGNAVTSTATDAVNPTDVLTHTVEGLPDTPYTLPGNGFDNYYSPQGPLNDVAGSTINYDPVSGYQPGSGIDWSALSAAEDAGLGAAFTEAGAGATAGSGFAGNVYGALGSGVGADLAASTAAANEAAAGAGMTAAGAGATAGAGPLGNIYGALSGVGGIGSALAGGADAAEDAAMGQTGRDNGVYAPTGTGPGGNTYGTGGVGAGTALSRILGGTGTAADWTSVLGNVAGAGLGAYASNQQASALDDLRQRYEGYGAPSRARYEASMTPGFDPSTIPGYQGAVDNSMQTMLRKLSTQGNPFGNPGGLIEANKAVVAGTALPALQNYQGANAASGGFNTFNAAAPGAAQASLGANNNFYNAIGGGIANLTNPRSTLEDMLKRFGGNTVNYDPPSGYRVLP